MDQPYNPKALEQAAHILIYRCPVIRLAIQHDLIVYSRSRSVRNTKRTP